MKHEKTQKKNPHGLTVNQHIFPDKSISRFLDNSGSIEVFLKNEKKIISVNSKTSSVFCAKRTWDQRAEKIYMKNIEDKYQLVADKICSGNELLEREHKIILDFYLLWQLRFRYFLNPIEDKKLNGVISVRNIFTKDEEERLEKENISFIRKDAIIPARQINGIKIQLDLMSWKKELKDKKIEWGIVEAKKGEFIVPDNFSSIWIVPLMPNKCLIANEPNGCLLKDSIAELNKVAIADSEKYYFARDFTNCPQ